MGSSVLDWFMDDGKYSIQYYIFSFDERETYVYFTELYP